MNDKRFLFHRVLNHEFSGGLESLKNLQQLIVDHNQLISTKGLCEAPTLIHLDCSFNHLAQVEGIENCGLLQVLKLQGNNLQEVKALNLVAVVHMSVFVHSHVFQHSERVLFDWCGMFHALR